MAGGRPRTRFSGMEDPEAPVDAVLDTLVSEVPQDTACDLTPMGIRPALPLPDQRPIAPHPVESLSEAPPIPPLPRIKPPAVSPAAPLDHPSAKMATRALHLGSGVACPVCGHLLALSIDRILSGAPVFCAECGLKLTLDVAKSRVGLEVLKRLKETVGNPAQGEH